MKVRAVPPILAVVFAIGLALSACPSSPSGVMTGRVYTCTGLAFANRVPPATLEVYRDNRLVVYRRLPNGSTYRFVLAPGHYLVSNTGNAQTDAHPFDVLAGQTVHLDIPDECM